jgi:hypothetical protein
MDVAKQLSPPWTILRSGVNLAGKNPATRKYGKIVGKDRKIVGKDGKIVRKDGKIGKDRKIVGKDGKIVRQGGKIVGV